MWPTAPYLRFHNDIGWVRVRCRTALPPTYCKMQTLPRGPVCLPLAASASPVAVVPIPTAHSLPHIRYPYHRSMSQLSALSPSTDNLAFLGLWERPHLAGLHCPCLGEQAYMPGKKMQIWDCERRHWTAQECGAFCEVTQHNFSLPLKEETGSRFKIHFLLFPFRM